MSWEATNWAVKQLAGSPGAKIVLLLLADRADERNSCWPSQERLAEESEQSVATVRRRLRDLESLGLIWTERRNVQGRKRATNRYVLAVSSSAQSDTQTRSTAQTDVLPLKSEHIYRSTVSAKPPLEPPVEEPPLFTPVDRFDEFWSVYPRKDAKQPAKDKSWPKAVTKVGAPLLIEKARQYAEWLVRENKQAFAMMPTTWLNQERWNDERRTTTVTNMDGHRAVYQEMCENENGSHHRNIPELEG